ncbi:hypothetical protein X975_23941, partial [Stegodyphus mimosarum]
MIEDHCLCLLNNGQNNYFHEPTRSFHALDLAICSPSLLPFSTFSVGNYPYNNDHFPILVSITRDRKFPMSRVPHFILTRADWELFSSLTEITEEMVKDVPIDDAVKVVTDVIIQAATVSIPKTSTKLPKYSKPWCNRECQDTLKQQRKAWGFFHKHPTLSNRIAFKKAKAVARSVRGKSQRDSWMSYVSEITSSMSSKRVWERVRKACGLYRDHTLSFLEKDCRVISASEEIANVIGENFAAVSVSGSLYVDDLQINCFGGDMRYIERQLQIAINRIQKWSGKQGFVFSKEKTVCVHFCKKRGLHPEPQLCDGPTVKQLEVPPWENPQIELLNVFEHLDKNK